MAMNRAAIKAELQVGLNTIWGLEYKGKPEEWRSLFDTDTSDKAFEEDLLITGLGAAVVKPEGRGISFDEAIEGWKSRYEHLTIALAFRITQEAMEDNQYLKMGAKYTKAIARSMLHTKEIFGASIFNYAFDVNHLGGDKQPLLSAAHPLVGGGVRSNRIAAADLSEAAVESILTMIRKAEDDRGIPIALNAKQVVIPAEEQFNAVRLFESTLRPGLQAGATGALNDVNAINQMGIFGKAPTIITRLSDPNAWFIKTDATDSLKYFSRIAISNKMTDDWDTGDVKYGCRERYSFGWSDWRGLFGSPGST